MRTAKKAELADRRRKVSEMYLKGVNQSKIAEILGVNQSQVSRDIKYLINEWESRAVLNTDRLRYQEIAKINLLEREYWEAWERSREDLTVKQMGERSVGKQKSMRVVNRDGDPRFLAGVEKCIDTRRLLLGPYTIENPSDKSAITWNTLADVAATVFPDDTYTLTPFHRWLLAKLTGFIVQHKMGLAPRLQISLPPQHGKSEAARLMVAHAMATARCRIAWASYNVTFARKASRTIRDWFMAHRPDMAGKDDKKTEAEWSLSNGSAFLATAPGGTLTGEVVDLLVIDDLHKNFDDYCSRTRRDKMREWLHTVVSTRLRHTSSVLIIGTRWGQDDAIDAALDAIPGNWETVSIPAVPGYNVDTGEIAETLEIPDPLHRKPGQVLWEEEFSRDFLIEKMLKAGPITAAAQYQQNPRLATGNFFDMSKWHLSLPNIEANQRTAKARFWDLGFAEGGHNTAGAMGYVGIDGSPIVIEDMLVFSSQWPVTKQRIIRQAKLDGKDVIIGIEANGPQLACYQEVLAELKPLGYTVRPRRSKPDSESDARRWQSIQWGGNVYLGESAKTVPDKADRFPAMDIDEIDAISGLYWMCRPSNRNRSTAGAF